MSLTGTKQNTCDALLYYEKACELGEFEACSTGGGILLSDPVKTKLEDVKDRISRVGVISVTWELVLDIALKHVEKLVFGK